MMDGIAAARGLGQAARPPCPGAPGQGVGQGRGRGAERDFAALVGQPAEAPADDKADEPATEEALPEAVVARPAQAAAPVPRSDSGLCLASLPGETPDLAVERPDGADLDPPGPEVDEGAAGAGERASGLDLGDGLATSWMGQTAPMAVSGPAHRPQGAVEEGTAVLTRHDDWSRGPSRAESVLAALVAAQASAGPSSTGPVDAGPGSGPGGDSAMSGSERVAVRETEAVLVAGTPAGPPLAEGRVLARPGPAAPVEAPPTASPGEDRDAVAKAEPKTARSSGTPSGVLAPGAGTTEPRSPAAPLQVKGRHPGGLSATTEFVPASDRGQRLGAGTEHGAAAVKAGPPGRGKGRAPGLEASWPGDRASPFDAGPVKAGVVAGSSDGPQTTRHIARQVAIHPVLRTGGEAEITLNPAELGHLRLTVEGSEGALRVVIEAARPETADLLRRHVETLRQELRQEGLGSVGVSIGGGESRGGGEAASRGGAPRAGPSGLGVAAASLPPSPAAPATREPNPAGHLDLRF